MCGAWAKRVRISRLCALPLFAQSLLVVLLLGVGLAAGLAQESPKPEAPQTGEGAQVRTGSAIGSGADQVAPSRLAFLLRDHQFLELEKLLHASDGAAAGDAGNAAGAEDAAKPAVEQSPKLAPQQAQFFRGVLANRENNPQESIRLLEPLLEPLPEQSKSGGTSDAGNANTAAGNPVLGNPEQVKILRETLAEDYLRAGDWAKAARAYRSLNTGPGPVSPASTSAGTGSNAPAEGSLTPEEKDAMELPLKLLPLVAAHPPMTVERGDPFTLPYERDPLGLTDVPVFVDARTHEWMLDPTAPFNLIARSSAKQIGLKISEESATVRAITGRPMVVHATVIPRFTIGTVTYRNMTAFVFDDADYSFPQSSYQVQGVLGYPGVSALGSLTVTADAKIEVQPGEKGERLTTGAKFYLDGDRVLAALGTAGEERIFAVDAAGQQTYLSSRYFAEHSNDFADKKMQLLRLPGQQPVPAYLANSLTLAVGDTPVTFQEMQIITEPLGSAAIDDTYGTLGMDALDSLKSYTFDYRTMRFGVRNH